MRIIYFALVTLLISFASGIQAQSKIGYIATDELIGLMPEAEKADADLKEYQASLAQQGQDMMKELTDKDSLFVKDSAKLSPSMREIKRNELMGLYQRVQNWNQQAQELYQQKAQEMIAPLRAKVMEAIKSVKTKYKYDFILDKNAVIEGPAENDVLELVKKELGIKQQKPVNSGK
jgi:outer membrane protein